MKDLGVKTHLRSGFSTGSHGAAAFKGALRLHLFGETGTSCEIPLPAKAGGAGPISIELEQPEQLRTDNGIIWSASSRKGTNDDEDVTKGLLIRCLLSNDMGPLRPFLNPAHHTPHVFRYEGRSVCELNIFAGKGVGVATLPGLRVAPGFPAINPGPLSVIEMVFRESLAFAEAQADSSPIPDASLFAVLSIEDGESVALKTANGRVGIVGGLSLLGSQGIVKPLSSEAYLESLRAEVSVARRRGGEVFFVIGSPSLRHAESLPPGKGQSIIETGNFLYDSLLLFRDHDLPRLTIVAGAGKMTRLALGFRNTHQKFGEVIPASILDFAIEDAAKRDAAGDSAFPKKLLPHIRNCPRTCATVRAIEEHLREESPAAADALMRTIARRGALTLQRWIEEEGVCIREIRTVLLDRKARPWTCTLTPLSGGTPENESSTGRASEPGGNLC